MSKDHFEFQQFNQKMHIIAIRFKMMFKKNIKFIHVSDFGIVMFSDC